MAYIFLLKALWLYSHGFRHKIIAFVFLLAVAQVAVVIQPIVFAQILNSLQLSPDNIINTVLFWLVIWVGLFFWYNILHRFGMRLVYDVSYCAKQNFLNEHYKILTRLPLKWHSDNHSGDTINRINTAATALFNFCVHHYIYVPYMIMFWGPLIALWVLSWHISLITFLIAVASIFLLWVFDKRLVVLYREINARQHKIAATFFDYVSNIKTIITLRFADNTHQELNRQIGLGHSPYMKAEAEINQWKWLCVNTGVLVLEAGVIFYYIWQQLRAGVDILIGNVAAVFQYLQQISRTYLEIAQNYQRVIAWRTDFEEVSAIKKEYDSVTSRLSVHIANEWNTIHIDNLSFGYSEDQVMLRDISLSITNGENIALVGESGSGKSSLMACLRGLYTPQKVRLSVDDKDYESLDPLFDLTTLIPQEPEIFENTVLYNITFGLDYAIKDIEEAIRMACFDRVLARLPKGLQSDIRERGVTLSGGERQRLALARGILAAKKSKIILMDEPTSSVDAQNEASIYDNILVAFTRQTVISSLHRLHPLNKFDKIIVMKDGRIVQTGKLEDLKDRAGHFQDLWRAYHESSGAENALPS